MNRNKLLLVSVFLMIIIVGCTMDLPTVHVTITPPQQATVQAMSEDFKIDFGDNQPKDMFELIGYQYMKNRPAGALDVQTIRIFKLRDKDNGNLIYLTNSGAGVGISVIKP